MKRDIDQETLDMLDESFAGMTVDKFEQGKITFKDGSVTYIGPHRDHFDSDADYIDFLHRSIIDMTAFIAMQLMSGYISEDECFEAVYGQPEHARFRGMLRKPEVH